MRTLSTCAAKASCMSTRSMSASARPGAVERLGHRERRAHQELIGRIDADVRPAAERRERLEAERRAFSSLISSTAAAPSVSGARVAGGERAVLGEDRAQLGELLDASCRRARGRRRAPTCRPASSTGTTSSSKRPDGDRRRRALVRAHRELVLRLARDLVAPRHLARPIRPSPRRWCARRSSACCGRISLIGMSCASTPR